MLCVVDRFRQGPPFAGRDSVSVTDAEPTGSSRCTAGRGRSV
jgi:hypothetical protein